MVFEASFKFWQSTSKNDNLTKKYLLGTLQTIIFGVYKLLRDDLILWSIKFVEYWG